MPLDCRFERNGRSLGSRCPRLPPFGSRVADCTCTNMQQRHLANLHTRSNRRNRASTKPVLPYLPIRTTIKPSASAPDWEEARKRKLPLLEQLEHCQTPVVVDADALNILANHRHTPTHLPKGSILTPHPKELERLTGKCQDSYERLMKALRTGPCRPRPHYFERRLLRHYHPGRKMFLQPNRKSGNGNRR